MHFLKHSNYLKYFAKENQATHVNELNTGSLLSITFKRIMLTSDGKTGKQLSRMEFFLGKPPKL